MKEKVANSIVAHQTTINELKELKELLKNSLGNTTRFIIETKHWYGYFEPFLGKTKSNLNISRYTMELILEEAIKKEKDRINTLIEMEIDKEIEKRSK